MPPPLAKGPSDLSPQLGGTEVALKLGCALFTLWESAPLDGSPLHPRGRSLLRLPLWNEKMTSVPEELGPALAQGQDASSSCCEDGLGPRAGLRPPLGVPQNARAFLPPPPTALPHAAAPEACAMGSPLSVLAGTYTPGSKQRRHHCEWKEGDSVRWTKGVSVGLGPYSSRSPSPPICPHPSNCSQCPHAASTALNFMALNFNTWPRPELSSPAASEQKPLPCRHGRPVMSRSTGGLGISKRRELVWRGTPGWIEELRTCPELHLYSNGLQ